MQKFHFNSIAITAFALSVMVAVQLVLPVTTQTSIVHPIQVGEPTALVPLSTLPAGDADISKAMSPEQLSAVFFLDTAAPRHEVGVTTPVAPKKAPEPQVAGDLSLIGRVVVDSENAWALYDRKRNTSFTISVGKSWADWYCVAIDSHGILLKKKEELFVVLLK